jgi:hypothetical protein
MGFGFDRDLTVAGVSSLEIKSSIIVCRRFLVSESDLVLRYHAKAVQLSATAVSTGAGAAASFSSS